METQSLFERQMVDFMELALENLSELSGLSGLPHKVEVLAQEIAELRREVRENHRELVSTRSTVRRAGRVLSEV